MPSTYIDIWIYIQEAIDMNFIKFLSIIKKINFRW